MANDYQLPPRMRQMQQRVRTTVGEFLQRHEPEESVLLLDSTGPTATRHYAMLSAIGRERLLRFKEIHAFSGGAFAVFGFLGLTSHNAKLSFESLRAPSTERVFRKYHHPSPMSVPRAVMNLVRQQSVFQSNRPVYDMLEHIFRPEYTRQPYSAFPSNVTIYLGQKGQPAILRLANSDHCDEACAPLRDGPLIDAVAAAVTVPMVYGRGDGKDRFFDPVYAGGYGRLLRELSGRDQPTLVSTPWKKGSNGKVTYVNCCPSERQKMEMLKDFARLVLNLPNHGWGHDIYAAFES
jgi:hypothetical protein